MKKIFLLISGWFLTVSLFQLLIFLPFLTPHIYVWRVWRKLLNYYVISYNSFFKKNLYPEEHKNLPLANSFSEKTTMHFCNISKCFTCAITHAWMHYNIINWFYKVTVLFVLLLSSYNQINKVLSKLCIFCIWVSG